MADEVIKTCEECGAAVYPDHLESGAAGYVDGKLCCPICYREHEKGPSEQEADERIALVDDAELERETTQAEAPQIRAFGQDSVFGQVIEHDESRYNRPLNYTGRGALRCRTFHSKLTDASIAYMDHQINEWTEENPQIEIKFAASAIGMFEGKQREEPHLIVTIFY